LTCVLRDLLAIDTFSVQKGKTGDQRPFPVMTAVSLMQQAVNLLTRAPLKTLKVVAPALVMMAGVGTFASLTAPDLLSSGPSKADLTGFGTSITTIGILTAFVLSYAMLAILWHRHTLCDAHTAKPITLPLLLKYLWHVLALALIQLGVSLALVIPLMIVSHNGSIGAAAPSLVSVMLSTFIMQLVLLWLSLRLSLILPAAALGKPIRMLHSWQYTRPVARSLWGVAAALALANSLFAGLITLLDFASPGHRLAIELPIYVLEGLLIFSVLTALYAMQTKKSI
jgi:hypothetical protein